MKKLMTTLAITLALVFMLQVAAPTNAKAGSDKAAAALLSMIVPGAGEWYNSDFDSPFPWVECIAGYICPCIQLSSIFDAAIGDSSERMRLDFWSSPKK